MQICFAFISRLGSWNIVMSDFQLLLKNMLAFRITKENVTEMTQEHSAVRYQIKKNVFLFKRITFIAWASNNR